jgi:ribosomal protein S18 acetylase RimI-like enzyme
MTIEFLKPEQMEAYRQLRLDALRESPTAFGASYEEEALLSVSDFAARLRSMGGPPTQVFVATIEGRLVGMIGFSRERPRKRAHIGSLWTMYVRPEFRGRGIGGALLDAAINHGRVLYGLRQITLTVTATNPAACALYRSRGFESYGLHRDALCIDGKYFPEELMVLFVHGHG